VLLDGFYGRLDHYRRPRYKCVPAHGKPHRFTTDLARRQPTADHPHGPDCQHCGHAVARHEGPETPRGFVYSAREIAEVLVALGAGTSFRKASAKLRRDTGRISADKYGNRRTSRSGMLAVNYLVRFAPLIIDELLPRTWPPSLVLDGKPFLRRTTYDDGAPRQGGPLDFQVYGAYGYTGAKGTGFLWRLDMRGGQDNVEWAAFLRSLPDDADGPPDWVVADDSGAIRNAVKAVWPKATFYVCEKHLNERGNKALAKDHIFGGHELYALWREAQWTRDNWQKFLDALDASGAENMKKWIKRKGRLIERQFDLRRSDRVRATGAIETALDHSVSSVGERHFVLRNAARLRLLLGLVTLHEREDDDVRAYTNLIRKALLANGGRPARRGYELNDPKRQGSIAAEAALVEERLGEKRARARRASQEHEAKEAVKRQKRRRERYEREGRILPEVAPVKPPPSADQETLRLD
jgi:hypothetical protein